MARVAPQRRKPFGQVELAARVQRAAAEHRPFRQGRAEQVRHFGVERTAGPRPDRSGRAAEPVDDAPTLDGERGAEGSAELEHHERGLGEVDAEPDRLIGDAQRDARDLVRGSQVDPVPLAVGGNRRQLDRAGAEHERQLSRDQRAHDRAHAADADTAVRLILAEQQHERELALGHLLGGNQRQPVAGWAEHEVERAVLDERTDEQRRIGTDVDGAEAALEADLAAVERAHVERDRARVDAGHARPGVAQTRSSLAIA